ncbi:MAG: hypothetical protein ACJ76P_05945 [Actinomycetota bacterium]
MTAETPLLTNAAVLEVVRNAGFEAIITGGLVPTVRETIAAAGALESLERKADTRPELAEVRSQVEILLDLIRDQIGESGVGELISEFERRLAAREAASASASEGTETESGDAQ